VPQHTLDVAVNVTDCFVENLTNMLAVKNLENQSKLDEIIITRVWCIF